jgi:hypothetical protein
MIVQWLSVLGITGFLCGFIGPMVLAPDANQGPMVGIFISGPGGVLLGVILGGLVKLAGWTPSRSRQALQACAVLLAIVTLYFCIPMPSYRADVVEGEIRSCIPAGSLRDKAIKDLKHTSAGHRPSKPINWEEKFDHAIGEKPGVVLTVHMTRFSRVFEKQARWNRGDLLAKDWKAADKDVRYFADYAGSDCAQYPSGTTTTLMATGHTDIWPAYGIAEMLNVKQAEPLPPRYAKLFTNSDAGHTR